MRLRPITINAVRVFGLLGVSLVLAAGATASAASGKAVLTVSVVGRGKITSRPGRIASALTPQRAGSSPAGEAARRRRRRAS